MLQYLKQDNFRQDLFQHTNSKLQWKNLHLQTKKDLQLFILWLGQGRDKARAFLMENPEILKQIETEVRAVAATAGAPAVSPSGGSSGASAEDAEPASE